MTRYGLSLREAAKEHVSRANTRRTDWFVAREDEQIAGIAALMQVGSGYRLKGAWVDPAHRKRGVYIALNRHGIAIAEARCGVFIESLSLHPGFFDANGFTREGYTANGAIRVRRIL